MYLEIKILIIVPAILFNLAAGAFEGPRNTIAHVGGNVTMRCKPSPKTSNCSGIIWLKRPSHDPNGHPTTIHDTIFRGEQLLKVDLNRYSVDRTSGCHVVIRDVQYNDSGLYNCQAVMEDKSTPARSALLVVLESEGPRCKVKSSSMVNGSAVEGDDIRFTCDLTQSGAKVRMAWKNVAITPEVGKVNRTGKLVHSTVATRPGVQPLRCEIFFEPPNEIKDIAVNSLSVSCQTPAVDVLYPVTDVRLSPQSSSFPPGSTVTCHADGNPPPIIKWQSRTTLNLSTTWQDIPDADGNKLIVGNDLFQRYRCIASNIIRNSNHSEFSCQISAGDSSLGTKAAVAVGFAAGFLAAVLLSVVACCIQKRVRHQTNEAIAKE